MWLCSAAFSVACLGSSDLCHKLALFCQNGLYRNGPWCQFPFSIIIKIRKYCIEISKVLIYGLTNFQYRFKFSELWFATCCWSQYLNSTLKHLLSVTIWNERTRRSVDVNLGQEHFSDCLFLVIQHWDRCRKPSRSSSKTKKIVKVEFRLFLIYRKHVLFIKCFIGVISAEMNFKFCILNVFFFNFQSL
jgi:hypothetical protein